VLRGAVGAAVLWAVYALVRRSVPSAMGGGDVKLAGSVGAALAGVSWSAVAIGTVLAAVLTAAAGTVLRVAAAGIRRARPAAAALAPATPGAHAVPHGPSMLLACLITVTAAAAWPGPAGVG
jgi:leader peptidase (prepilin peptidase)/N-methyltransferase